MSFSVIKYYAALYGSTNNTKLLYSMILVFILVLPNLKILRSFTKKKNSSGFSYSDSDVFIFSSFWCSDAAKVSALQMCPI